MEPQDDVLIEPDTKNMVHPFFGSHIKWGSAKVSKVESWSHPPGATGAAHNSRCSLGRRLSVAERLAN